ncbi:MAG: hypothetical protein RJA35_1397 [Actinomycetota bacterium]|jgi:Na+/melibiose symporter-like transporter
MAKKEDVQIRRAPKFQPFLLTGGAFGLVLAFVLFFATGQNASKDWASTLGVMIVFMSAVGAFGGLYLAVVFDRVSKSKSKVTTATKLEE